ncbi:helix-turn-helix domain-containing protein [Aquabacterium humicola]|uniref:helix-turn-helix domain-containing protein n=1 Tax=Aquabacterium humicola TaxID=3237377 RepID=UPI002543D747|nr:helix-turn-helix domain-containing protein [Rubrivivax pictus]
MPRPPPAPNLPTYALYGEHGRTQATDWLHCETIRERSQRHDWEIKPHRHESLFQILYIRSGRAQALLEGLTAQLRGPCLLTVAALAPHGFRFDEDVDGTVITVLERHLAQLLSGAGTLAARVMRTQVLGRAMTDAASHAVEQAVKTLRDEFFGTAPWRDLKLDAALLALAVELGRALPDPTDAAPEAAGERALAHVRRLRALIEARFREQPTLGALAREIGITPTQLNRACHQVLGHSALGVLHGRLVLEAQRDLAYTTLGVKQIALGLGFAEAGYFTRFFQRETGLTPTAWRAQALR